MEPVRHKPLRQSMDSIQQSRLVTKVNEGQIARDFCKHPGFSVYKAEVEKKILDTRNLWLAAPSAELAEQMRHEAKGLAQAFEILKAMMVQGDIAQAHLNRNAQESERQD